MSGAGEFIRSALEYEGDPWRAADARDRVGDGLDCTGASVGAVRGTVRDALVKFRGLGHDEVTALASELWESDVFEARSAALVLLQSRIELLRASDLTRLEGFARGTGAPELLRPLALDVLRPLLAQLPPAQRARADTVLDRWRSDPALAPTAELAAT